MERSIFQDIHARLLLEKLESANFNSDQSKFLDVLAARASDLRFAQAFHEIQGISVIINMIENNKW